MEIGSRTRGPTQRRRLDETLVREVLKHAGGNQALDRALGLAPAEAGKTAQTAIGSDRTAERTFNRPVAKGENAPKNDE